MLIVEKIAKIRRYHFVHGRGIKEISRKLGVSRNTARKVIRGDSTEHHYVRKNQPIPRLGEYVERLEKLLDDDWKQPKKRRLTARPLCELLQAEGYERSYDSIQRFTKQWREKKGKNPGFTFIPLHFVAGDAFQFDWSHELVALGGVTVKINVAHFRLCHSRLFFVVAYLGESTEMVFDATVRSEVVLSLILRPWIL